VVKYLALFAILILTTYGCSKTIESPSNKYQPFNELVFINVVEKKIIEENYSQTIYSEKTKKKLINWLDKDIKTNGYEGYVEIKISDIATNEKIIENDLIINISVKLDLSIFNSALDSRKIISINGEEYGQLTGSFTLDDKSIEVENIIKRLIEKLSIKLVKEVN
jgi:hypothetical protein